MTLGTSNDLFLLRLAGRICTLNLGPTPTLNLLVLLGQLLVTLSQPFQKSANFPVYREIVWLIGPPYRITSLRTCMMRHESLVSPHCIFEYV